MNRCSKDQMTKLNWLLMHPIKTNFLESARFQRNFQPFIIYAGAETNATLPIFANRFKANENWIYICKNNNCALPVQNIAAALPLI